MKCILALTLLVAPVTGRLLRQQNSTADLSVAGRAVGTCPSYLQMLRHEALHSPGDHPELKVVDVPRQGNNGFGPAFQTGLRYLLFDEDHSSGFIGVRCKIQSAVRCKPSSVATGNSTCAGKPCDPDVHNPPLQYVKIQLGGALAGLVASRGKIMMPGPAPVWGAAPQPKPLAVATVGVGAGSIPAWFLASFKQIAVHAVEIDEAVFKASVDCFGLPGSDARLTKHIQDGVEFFNAPGTYDLVMLDVAPMPKHFRENVMTMKNKITPGGVLAVNGFAHDTEWQAFKQEAKKDFASVWVAGDGKYNEVIVAVAAGGGQNVADIAKTPTQDELTAGGAPVETATWFTEAHWAKA